MEIKKYDVVYGKFSESNSDSVQSGYRPGIVISNKMHNEYSPTLLILPLSTRMKKLNMPTHHVIKKNSENGLRCDSVVLAEQITSVGKSKVKKIGEIKDRELQLDIFRCFVNSVTFGDSDLEEMNSL